MNIVNVSRTYAEKCEKITNKANCHVKMVACGGGLGVTHMPTAFSNGPRAKNKHATTAKHKKTQAADQNSSSTLGLAAGGLEPF